MEIKIKRLNKSLPLPEQKTKGAAGYDLSASEDIVIKSHEVAMIPLGVSIALPKGTWAILSARSSAHKLGIMPANGIGIIDSDYCGDSDEWKFLAYNFTKKTVKIEKGIRIAQFIVVKTQKIDMKEVSSLSSKNRGGFGSTGRR